jgi:D-serine deaminase-like pyridoxal phosphate-dependent protein
MDADLPTHAPASPAARVSHALIGEPGSRWRMPTPALVLDLDRLDANIARMARRAAAAGIALRPHAKTHKSAFIARRQIAAGAGGICCAKLGEAEALAAAGIGDILLTSPIATPDLAARAATLAATCSLAAVLDHQAGAHALQTALAVPGTVMGVFIDVDVGLGRTGVASIAAALALADAIAESPMLRLRGVQGYGGHWQHLKGEAGRRDAVAAGMARLSAVVDALRQNGHACPVITGGGTGSFAADAALGVLTEVQPGSYVYMDTQYADALGDDPDGDFATALCVQARVISTNQPNFLTLDAGLKAFATDAGVPRAVTPRFAGLGYFFFGDEHGGIARPLDGGPVNHDTRIEFAVPHCDPTVDRYDYVHVVQGDVLVGVAAIEAARRGQ